MQRFFEEGDKVKVTLRFRGREMAHQELGTQLLNRLKDDTAKIAKVEMDGRLEGRQMVMVLAPALTLRRLDSGRSRSERTRNPAIQAPKLLWIPGPALRAVPE